MKTAAFPSQGDESFYYMHGGIVLILWLCITVILRRGDRVKLWEWGDLNLSLGIQQGTRERLTTAHHCFFIFTLAPVFNLEIVWEDFQVFVFHKTLPNNIHYIPTIQEYHIRELHLKRNFSNHLQNLTGYVIGRIYSRLLSQEDCWRTAEEKPSFGRYTLGVSWGSSLTQQQKKMKDLKKRNALQPLKIQER